MERETQLKNHEDILIYSPENLVLFVKPPLAHFLIFQRDSNGSVAIFM